MRRPDGIARIAGARLPGMAVRAVFAALLAVAAVLAFAPVGPAGMPGAAGCALASEASDAAASAPEVFDERLGGDRGILPVGLDEQDATYVTIARLAGADESLDSSLVMFRGEAVGEPVNSSVAGYRWVLLQTNVGSTSSVEVLMSDEQVSQIQNFGSYKTKGSTLRVTGIYRVADPNQTGQLDVTAYGVRVVDEGGPVDEAVDMGLLGIGIALVALGVGLNALNIYLKRRSRS